MLTWCGFASSISVMGGKTRLGAEWALLSEEPLGISGCLPQLLSSERLSDGPQHLRCSSFTPSAPKGGRVCPQRLTGDLLVGVPMGAGAAWRRVGGFQGRCLVSGARGERHRGLTCCFCSGDDSRTLLWPLFGLRFSKLLVWCQTPHPSDPRKMGSACTRQQKAALGNVKLGCPNWSVCPRHNNQS